MTIVNISVVIPVYNVEKYLHRCVDSVLKQDFDDYEIILVDDGSTDTSSSICDEYSDNNEKVKVIHKFNGGLPSARMVGVRAALGKYVVHLDSDDYLLPDALALLYDEITIGGFDIVRTRVLREDNKGRHWNESYEINEGEIINEEDCIIAIMQNKISPYLHSAIYKKSLFSVRDFQRLVDNGVSVGEDWVTNMLLSKRVNSIKVIDKSTHVYCWNSESMMPNSVISPKISLRFDKVLEDIYCTFNRKLEYERKIKTIVGYISACFYYEIPFDKDRYSAIKTFLSEPKNRRTIKNRINPKFLRGIECKFLFKLYCRAYANLVFLFKQKCMRRKVVE